MAGVIAKPRSRILHGHDWIYPSEILRLYGAPADGDVIAIKDSRERFLGLGFFNSRSPVRVRRFTMEKVALDLSLVAERIRTAVRRRSGMFPPERPMRLFWSESDGLPGLVIDRYKDTLVLQTNTPAMDRMKNEIASMLPEITGTTGGVWERNDSQGRITEGLPPLKGPLIGNPARMVSFQIADVVFDADLLEGHKTGFYLDQLDAYARVAGHAKGKRVLDCFANQGGFGLACARAGAAEVVAVESGAEAVTRLEHHAAANQLEVKIVRSDVFAYLRSAERARSTFDLIILDPPSFSKGQGAREAALRGYNELHLRAARLLAPGGLLATFSCSHSVGAPEFMESAARAAWDAGVTFRLVERFHQPVDHPVLPHIPETEYIKGFLLETR